MRISIIMTAMVLLVFASASVFAAEAPASVSSPTLAPQDDYSATLRLYIVEPVSRWQDATLAHYSFGFLSYAAVVQVAVPDAQSWTRSFDWDGVQVGYQDIQEDNIMVIAVLFNNEQHQGDAFPPYGFWFDAFYVDATAASTPGVIATDQATSPSTHTVFIEEGTETG